MRNVKRYPQRWHLFQEVFGYMTGETKFTTVSFMDDGNAGFVGDILCPQEKLFILFKGKVILPCLRIDEQRPHFRKFSQPGIHFIVMPCGIWRHGLPVLPNEQQAICSEPVEHFCSFRLFLRQIGFYSIVARGLNRLQKDIPRDVGLSPAGAKKIIRS